jgi:ABC-type multidrug transport system fused ATPase/permease subunit
MTGPGRAGPAWVAVRAALEAAAHPSRRAEVPDRPPAGPVPVRVAAAAAGLHAVPLAGPDVVACGAPVFLTGDTRQDRRRWKLYRTFPEARATHPAAPALAALATAVVAALAVALPTVALTQGVGRLPLAAAGPLLLALAVTSRDRAAARFFRDAQARLEPAAWDRALAPAGSRVVPVAAGTAVAQYRSLVAAALLDIGLALAVAIAALVLLATAARPTTGVVAGVLVTAGAVLFTGSRRRVKPSRPERALLAAALTALDEIHLYARESAVARAALDRPVDRPAARRAECAAAVAAALPALLLAAVTPLWAAGADPRSTLIAGCALVPLGPVLTRVDALVRSVFVVGAELFGALRAAAAAPADPWAAGAAMVHGAISVDDVTLLPHGAVRPSLVGLSLTVGPGEFVAVIGPSGSGKSALLRLLAGLDAPVSGTVRVDGMTLTVPPSVATRAATGFVPQDADAPRGTVRSVVLGPPDGSPDADERAFAALRAAGLAERVATLPMGLATVVAGGSNGFSTSELQLMLLARAYARNPRLLLIDELADAAGPTAVQRLVEHLRSLPMTRLVVTHDARLARAADRIVVLIDGAVAASGTYDDLVTRRGAWAHLFDLPTDEVGEPCDTP